MSAGNDGMSNCETLCNPENHYEWSCKHYCPDYVYTDKPVTTSVKTITVSMDTKGGPKVSVAILATGSVLATLVIAFLILCILYKRKGSRSFCCLRKEEIGPPVQETGDTFQTLVRYENELNDQKEQREALLEHGKPATVDAYKGNDITMNSTTNCPEESRLVFNSDAVQANVKDTYENGTETLSSSGTSSLDESRCLEPAITHNCSNCADRNIITGNQVQSENQITASFDTEADTSDDDITIGEDSNEEDENEASTDSSMPKRLVRVITEIEV